MSILRKKRGRDLDSLPPDVRHRIKQYMSRCRSSQPRRTFALLESGHVHPPGRTGMTPALARKRVITIRRARALKGGL